ncbi:MAG: PAS domain-containing protein, partial [Alphaproteobacteria bacterium]|nr:PAS domain-containing protein [Alphaproteobacteria bacterium]
MSIFFGSTGAGHERDGPARSDNHRALSPTMWSAITAAVFALCAGITALMQAQPTVIAVFALGAVAAAGLSAWYTVSDGRAVSTAPAAPSPAEFSLAHAMDALPGGIVVVDEESRPLYANATFQTLSGDLTMVPAHAIAAMLGAEAAEDALADRLQDLEAKARGGEIGVADLEVQSPTGELAWWRTTARPIPGMHGLILWQLEDITETRHMEQAVESEREKVLEFLADAPIGFYAVDPQGHFLFANEALARLLEVPVKDLLSQRYRLSDFLPAVAAGDMTLEEALGDRHGHDEIVLRSRSGNARPVSISQSVGQDQAIGRPITRGIVRDLASDREFEVALRRS